MKNVVLFLSVLFLSSCNNEKKNITKINNTIPEVVDYNIHIKPILSDRCFACHGPDKASQKAGLALHTPEKAYAELKENPGHFAIVQGKVDRSEVVKRIMSKDEEEMMPPVESNLKLNDYECQLIVKWIEQGAVYKPHWSLISVEKPEIPEIKNKVWVSNPIDNFILSKLESLGLKPEEKATKEKLIRRASFDITGLPPTIEEIDDFLNDESENAYEKVVDRLLGSVAYAEHMASRWLDISRYADSHGYQDDFYRSMWAWREWVIKAYNENKPFDEFLTWQMAGDLLPDATYEQKLATGFNRNHSINQEGGIIEEEFKVEYVADRANTLGTAVLGLTVECARCHDHKYDPISQKNYYELYGFFNSVPDEGKGRLMGAAPGPSVKYPEEKLNELRAYLTEINNKQTKTIFERKQEVYNNPLKDEKIKTWINSYTPEKKNAHSLSTAPVSYFPFDNLDDSSNPDEWNINNKEKQLEIIRPNTGKYGKGLFITRGQNYDLGESKFIDESQPFTISFWFFNKFKNGKTILSKIDEQSKSGIKIETHSGYIHIMTPISDKNSGERLISDKLIPDGKWTHLTVAYDASGSLNGFTLYVNGEPMKLNGDKEQAFPHVSANALLKIATPYGLSGSGIDEIFLFDKELNQEEILSVVNFNPIDALIQKEFTQLKEEDKNLITDHFLYHKDREFQIALRNLKSVRYKKLDVPDEGDVKTMVMADLPEPNKTYILNRGAYDAPGEEVLPGTPESIMSFSDSLPKNRLGLAKWLVDPKNPLPSRVAVNRYWQYIFGRGIVKTVDDFGNQGSLPSHPELLDWLASHFMENGWNTKDMIKMMVMSSTYQQSSQVSDEKRKADSENIYLARGPRYRMTVEMMRDQALAASGLLNTKVGGPSVRPYQPDNLWSAITGGGSGPLAKFVLDVSEDLYRRSLYTFWKRTVPPPSMLTFDAATRDRCIVNRQSTNTPLQALVLLNDPQYMEAARVMAQNLLTDKQPIESNITTAYRKLTGRKPDENELNTLMEVFNDGLDSFNKNPALISELIEIGDYPIDESLDEKLLAAHTYTISAILNLDETISKE
ncbi:DUF1553 domain-containing protein [Reichenbachiella sp. MALMAid0571]|uniref:DUF1553 domain-containing protein n=1 Tax=Reichenbachiella sp. MALMAid0571 TaxID=3143939 RepID=UPI0032DF587D